MSLSCSVAILPLPHGQDLPLPSQATADSAGYDLYAAVDSAVVLKPQQRQLIPCGFAMVLPTGFEAQIRPRSGLAFKHGITVLNAPGTIDADYRGEIKILLYNSDTCDSYTIERGMRVAQMVIARYQTIEWHVVDSITAGESLRNANGFGSTGY